MPGRIYFRPDGSSFSVVFLYIRKKIATNKAESTGSSWWQLLSYIRSPYSSALIGIITRKTLWPIHISWLSYIRVHLFFYFIFFHSYIHSYLYGPPRFGTCSPNAVRCAKLVGRGSIRQAKTDCFIFILCQKPKLVLFTHCRDVTSPITFYYWGNKVSRRCSG
jgi:hypothetical protein